MNEQRIKELKKIALEARKQIIIGVSSAKSGHPGGSLSIIDVLTYLSPRRGRWGCDACRNERDG